MIYLSKNNATEVITDNIIDFIPTILDVYLDDVLIGNFANLSHSITHLSFTCPKLELVEREYTMKIYTYKALIKEELIIVKDLSEFKVKSITKTKNITMYEK